MNLLKSNQSLNKGKIFYFDYKISKNGTTIQEFFQVSLLISVRNMFLSKAFSMSELNIYQVLRLNYYKNKKSVRQMTLMEIVLVLTCIETQKIQ